MTGEDWAAYQMAWLLIGNPHSSCYEDDRDAVPHHDDREHGGRG